MTSLPPVVITTAHERALFALHSPMRVLLATCCLYPNLELHTCLKHPVGKRHLVEHVLAVLLNDKLIAVGVRKALVGGGSAFVSKPYEARRKSEKTNQLPRLASRPRGHRQPN